MPGCFVFGCTSGSHGSHTHTFQLPRFCTDATKSKWINTLRRARSDKKYDPNNPSHRICHEHFEAQFLVKVQEVRVGNDINLLPKKNWTLTSDAVPTIFPSVTRNPVKSSPNKRKPPPDRCPSRNKRSSTYASVTCCAPDALTSDTVEDDIPSDTVEDDIPGVQISQNPAVHQLEDILTYWDERDTEFRNWHIKLNDTDADPMVYIFELTHHGHTAISKEIQIDKNLVCQLFVKEKPVNNYVVVPDKVRTFSDVNEMLKSIQNIQRCEGLEGYKSITEYKKAVRRDGFWFSLECKQLSEDTVCLSCKILARGLYTKQIRLNNETQIPSTAHLQKRNIYYRKRVNKLVIRNRNVRLELMKLRSTIHQLDLISLKRSLEQLKLDHGTRLSIMEVVRNAKAKSSKGIRYSTEWLLESTLLKIKSPAAYKHLRDCKLLPLPHSSTIKRLIAGSPCQFGFNQLSLQAIRQEFNGQDLRDRQGVLVFDELKLRKTLDFNKGTLKFDGYVNYGEYTAELTNSTELADHALVFAYRPYNANWMQPVAVFATKGAAKGPVLSKLLLECVVRLEAVGASVLCTVSDGATTNKNLWKHLGISGQKGAVENKIVHPCDDNRLLYFGSDVPHILKCIRNHFEKHTERLFHGKNINYNYYTELFKIDNENTSGLKKCPKLTKAHIWPNSFEKMRVNYASQLFSRSVETGIKFYREIKVKDMEGSENTEQFTGKINTLFDILNSRLPKDGLKPNSPGVEFLKSFYEILESKEANTFASPQTLESLRVSIKTTLEITEYLCSKLGFSYVLTAKLNQDCLEKFFGLIRAAGGREEHPTVSNFVQLYRLLSIYTPIKRVVRGNITSDDRAYVLANFTESLRSSCKFSKERRSEIHRLWETELAKKIIDSRSYFTNTIPHSFSTPEKNLIYHLTGFLVKKASKLVKCQQCISTLRSSALAERPTEAQLTEILDKEVGSLTHPSKALYYLILSNVEPIVSRALDSGELYGDILLAVIQRFGEISPNLIGCEEVDHGPKLLCKLIPYYIMMRFHFYSRAVKQDFLKLSRTKRKISKLQSS